MKISHQSIVFRFLWALFISTKADEQRTLLRVKVVTTASDPTNLGLCQGDCDRDSHCQDGLYCFQRDPLEPVPGCENGEFDSSRTDYCVYKDPKDQSTPDPTSSPTARTSDPIAQTSHPTPSSNDVGFCG